MRQNMLMSCHYYAVVANTYTHNTQHNTHTHTLAVVANTHRVKVSDI